MILQVSVVTHFVDRGFTTLMCGDGGNDCGALKTAHVGIALSDAEASIVSPFTSLDKTITSVVAVLREGRCALASALANYKFLVMYGQLTVVAHFFESHYHITFSEWCWIFVDGFWVIGLGFTLPLAKPADTLAPTRPTSSLLGVVTMASTVGVLAINVIFTGIAIGILSSRNWYQCGRQWSGDDISNVLVIGDNYEAQTLFIMMAYQLIATAVTYNFGYEFRASWFRNKWFVILVAIFTALHVFVILVPGTISCLFRMNCSNEHVLPSVATWKRFAIQNHWNTTLMPVGYRFTMLILIALNTLAVVCWDFFVVNGMRKRTAHKALGPHGGQTKFVPTSEECAPV
jgi:magnesium-transporting ATPase (P-type)